MKSHGSSRQFAVCIRAAVAMSCVGLIAALIALPVNGHGIFKKTLEKKYKDEGLRVTCNMCHVKGEPKTERNEFGQMFYDEFEGKDLSARWEAVEGDERKELEQDVMAPEFLEALERIYEREANGEAETNYNEMIPAGEVEGSKLKTRR